MNSKVQAYPKKRDTRQVYSIPVDEYNYKFELLHNTHDDKGNMTYWHGMFVDKRVGIIELSSTNNSYNSCSIIQLVFNGYYYSYSDKIWRTSDELIPLVMDFADDVVLDEYCGDEYLLENQEFPND